MPSSYSTNLKIELIPTGAQSGVWGATTNVNLGTALEQAIVGTATCVTADFTANVATYTLIDTNALQTARAFCLNITATLSGAGTINVPAIQKPYLVFNNSVGGFAVTVKVSGQTGVSIPNGRKVWLYNNGTDVGTAFDYAPSLALGSALLTTSGGTGLTSFTAGDLPYYATGTALSKLGIGTNGFVLTSSGSAPQWVSPSTVAIGTATNLAGGTTGALPYQASAGVTTFLPLGTTNHVMTAGATGPQYVAQSTLSVGSAVTATTATSATTATTATNLAGGAANQIIYQAGVGTTAFLASPATAGLVLGWTGTTFNWVAAPAATTASNLAGGAGFQVPYQTAPNVTAFSSDFQFNGTFLRVGTAAPLAGASNPTFAATANQNSYVQSYIYNANSGSLASADFVAYTDNSTDASGWLDVGHTSSTYADPTYSVTGPNESYVFGSAPSGAGKSGNLVYATDSTGSTNSHQWYVGGFNQSKSAWKMQLTSTGLQLANALAPSFGGTGLTTPGTAGNILTSTGTAWVSAEAPVTGPSTAKTYYMAQF